MRQRARNLMVRDTPKFRTPEERYEHDIQFVESEVGDELSLGYRRSPTGEQVLTSYRSPNFYSGAKNSWSTPADAFMVAGMLSWSRIVRPGLSKRALLPRG